MSLSDQRRYPRLPFHSRGQLVIDGEKCHGTLMDISLAGALFATDASIELSPGTHCRLAIYQPRRASGISIDGRVVHCAKHLFGLQFLHVGEAAAHELRRMVDMNLGMPRLLERDLAALLR